MTPAIAEGRLVDVLLAHLRAEGIDRVFGVPGGLLHAFFEAVEQPDFSLVVAKHEQGAAFMADGYARVSGKVAIAAATAGPGATNLFTGVAVAYADGVPMLVITGQAPSHTLDRSAAGDALLAARRPVLLVGSGASSPQARTHLVHLAETLNARVVTSPRAKGVFPEDHALSLGVFGFGGHKSAKDVVFGDDVDVLFCVGAGLNDDDELGPAAQARRPHVDPARHRRRPRRPQLPRRRLPRRRRRHHPARAVAHLRRRQSAGTSSSSTWPAAPSSSSSIVFDHADRRESDAVPLTPERWRADFDDAVPDDAIVFSDIGGHMLFNLHHLRVRRQQQFVLNLGFGSMGHGTVAPIGAKMARPERPVIAIVGDACFTMNGMELLSAVEYGVNVVWIVEDNQRHGINWHGSKTVSGGRAMDSVVYKHAPWASSSSRSRRRTSCRRRCRRRCRRGVRRSCTCASTPTSRRRSAIGPRPSPAFASRREDDYEERWNRFH